MSTDVPGSCVLVTQEGTRPILVEVQALVDTSHLGTPRRLTVGIDPQRLAMLLAVLHRHGAIPCFDQDVFLNVVGGLKITEPAADLAVVLSVVSSISGKVIPPSVFAFGEIGLAGEIRPAPKGQDRLKEAQKLGFKTAIVPTANMPKLKPDGLNVIGVRNLQEAIRQIKEF